MNPLILLILFISASYSASVCQSDQNCTLGKCVIYTPSISYCVCPSGVTGANCEVPLTCFTINSTVPSSVDFEHHYDDKNLQLRFDTALSSRVLGLQFSIGKPVGTDSSCGYPGVFCEHTVEKCKDVYNCEIPWDVALKCGWTTSQNHTLDAVVNFRVDVKNDDGSQTQTTFTSNISLNSVEQEPFKLSLLALILIIVVAVFLGLIVPIGLAFIFRYIYVYFWKEKEDEDYQAVVPGELKPTKSKAKSSPKAKTTTTKVKGLEDDSDPVVNTSDSTSVSSDQE